MSYCDKCPLNLFKVKDHGPIVEGVGDPWKGRVIVVPTFDTKGWPFDKQIQVIAETLSLSVEELLENVYLVPLIRCNEHFKCPIDAQIVNKCRMWLNDDIEKYEFKDILLLGSAVNNILKCNIRDYINYVCLRDKQRYFLNYSPFVKDKNAELFEAFKTYLIKWYNSSMSGMYDYEIWFLD